MSIRPFRDIKRNKTKVINVGPVKVGGNNPISVLFYAFLKEGDGDIHDDKIHVPLIVD